MAIDNPLDQIRNITDEDQSDPLGGFLQLGGAFHPLLAVGAVVKSVLDGQQRWEKMSAALRALCDELQQIQANWPKDMEQAINNDWFKRAIGALIEESIRSVNADHAKLLARVAAHGCFPSGSDAHRQEDLAVYIHDLASLGADDVRFLKLLKSANLEAIRTGPNLNVADAFSGDFDNFKRVLASVGIDPDDAVSLGARLSGFGLAYEAPRNVTRQSPVEHCFRPTKRGLYLLGLLEAAELPVRQQN